jgi:hypothetical protein
MWNNGSFQKNKTAKHRSHHGAFGFVKHRGALFEKTAPLAPSIRLRMIGMWQGYFLFFYGGPS